MPPLIQDPANPLHVIFSSDTNLETNQGLTINPATISQMPVSSPTLIHPSHPPVYVSLTAGAVAGALAKTTIAPLDRTKINFQIDRSRAFTIARGLRFIRDTVAKEGILALWRGNSATMIRIIPFASVQFASHEQWKKLLGIMPIHDHLPQSSIKLPKSSHESKKSLVLIFPEHFRRFLAGSLAGVTASTLTYPLDLARARMAVTEKSKYSNIFSVFDKIIRQEGWRSLYRGFTPTVMGSIPYAGTSFFTYETLKKLHTDKSRLAGGEASTPALHPMDRMLYGAVAGLVGQTSSYPLDIVRRRMQTTPIYDVTRNRSVTVPLPEPVGASSPVPPCPYTGVVSTARYIIKYEGLIKGMYKGLSMNWVKGPIAVGISFSTFDILQRSLQNLLAP